MPLYQNEQDVHYEEDHQDTSSAYQRQDHGSSTNQKQDNVIIEAESDREKLLDTDTTSRVARCFPSGFKKEEKRLLSLTWPILISTILDQLHNPVSVAFAGHLGKMELDAVSLGNSLSQVLAFSTTLGFLGVCSTFFAQSYGSVNQKQVGVYLQTGLYMVILTFCLYFAVLLNTNSLLLLLGQEPEIAANAELYMMMFMPYLLLRCVSILLQRYLNAQNIVFPPMVFGLISNLVHAGLQYLFVYVLDWGIRGSGGALSVAYIVNVGGYLAYILIAKVYRKTWNGWSRNALLEWANFTRLSLANIMMTGLEWWIFEIGTILIGILGDVELGTVAIMFQLWPMFGALGSGQRDAVSVRVGQHLGAKKPRAAMTVCRIAWLNSVIVGLVAAILLLALKEVLPFIFTTDPDIVALTKRQLPVLALFAFLVIVKWTYSGIILGCGKQVIGGWVSCVSYLLIALPIAVPLMFLTDLRSFGYWWGLIAGVSFSAVAYLFVLGYADWQKESDMAQIRAKTAKRKAKAKEEERNEFLQHDRISQLTCYTIDRSYQSGSVGSIHKMNTSTRYGALQASKEVNQSLLMSAMSGDMSFHRWTRIYILRLMNVACVLLVVLVGVLCRYVFFIPPMPEMFSDGNSTRVTNTHDDMVTANIFNNASEAMLY